MAGAVVEEAAHLTVAGKQREKSRSRVAVSSSRMCCDDLTYSH